MLHAAKAVLVVVASRGIRQVLRAGAEAQVLEAVIQAVAVDMVDVVPFRDLDAVQFENPAVHTDTFYVRQLASLRRFLHIQYWSHASLIAERDGERSSSQMISYALAVIMSSI